MGKDTATLDAVMATTKDGFSRLHGRFHAVEQRLGTLEQQVRKMPSGNDVSVPGVRVGIGKDQFSFFRAFKAITFIKRGGMSREAAIKEADAGFEFDVFRQTQEKRALSSDSDPAGAFLLPTEVGGPFIDVLRAQAIALALGARELTGLVGEVKVPAQTSTATAYWVGVNAAPTASQPAFGQKTLRPKKVGALVKIDNSLLRQTVNPGVEAIVRDDLAQVLGLEIDKQWFFGTGGDNLPLGLWETPGFDKTTVAIAANGGDPTFFLMLALEGVVEDANALKGRTGFAMNPKIRRVLKKERIPQFSGDAGGAYVIPPIITNKQLEEMLGHAIQVTTQFPTDLVKGTSTDCSPVIFGDWNEFVVAFWQNIELRASEEAGDASGGAFPQDQTWIRAFAETDDMVRHVEAFAGIADARINNA